MSTTNIPADVMNYHPLPPDRVYYESILNQDRGYLIKEEGKTYVERGKGFKKMLYRANEWKPALELRPLTKQHAGKIAFEADRGMLFALGKLGESRITWRDLTGSEGQEEKMRWVNGVGPGKKAEAPRVKLYKDIMKSLGEMIG